MKKEYYINKISVDYVANEDDCSEYMHVENVEKLINEIYKDSENKMTNKEMDKKIKLAYSMTEKNQGVTNSGVRTNNLHKTIYSLIDIIKHLRSVKK